MQIDTHFFFSRNICELKNIVMWIITLLLLASLKKRVLFAKFEVIRFHILKYKGFFAINSIMSWLDLIFHFSLHSPTFFLFDWHLLQTFFYVKLQTHIPLRDNLLTSSLPYFFTWNNQNFSIKSFLLLVSQSAE